MHLRAPCLIACSLGLAAWLLLAGDPPQAPPGDPRSDRSTRAAPTLGAAAADLPEPAADRTVVTLPAPRVDIPAAAVFPVVPPTRVEGRIVDSFGFPLRGIAVIAVDRDHGGGELRTASGAYGTFAFAALREGTYDFRVDARTLPRDLLTTDQSARARVRIEGERVDLGVGVLDRCARVEGHVGTATGQAVVLAQVRIRGLGTGMTQQVFTDDGGNFRCDGLRPGRYCITLALDHAAPALRALTLPIPLELELRAGADERLPPLFCGVGNATVGGRIVDENGMPMPNLAVSCFDRSTAGGPFQGERALQRVRTDAGGQFILMALPPGRFLLTLDCEPDGAAPGPSALALPESPRQLELAPNENLDLGRIQVRSRHLYQLRGRIEPPPRTALLGPFDLVAIVRDQDDNVQVPIAADGTFRWSCPTPRAPVSVHVRSRAKKIDSIARTVQPRPDGCDDLFFPLPQ